MVAIVGRPNVGKSTLFNCLTRSRSALVADEPGVTRDRQFGIARGAARAFVVIDTGGLHAADEEIGPKVTSQAMRAVDEAHLVLFLVDAKDGLAVDDQQIADDLRGCGRPVHLVVNKVDGQDESIATAEFHALGLGDPRPIAAAHRRGIGHLLEAIDAALPQGGNAEDGVDPRRVEIAMIGRPNVGKSTMINRLLGEERVIAHDAPGTTRDTLRVPFEYQGRSYTLLDTAGIRRRGRVEQKIERFSILKALEAIHDCDVVVLLADGRDGLTDQDTRLLGHVLEQGRALIVAVNKWDAVAAEDKRRVRSELERRLTFVDYAKIHFVSALRGRGLDAALASADAAARAARTNLSTAELTRVMAAAVAKNPPPMVRGRRVKLRYAHQGGSAPPRIIIHGNQTEALPRTYARYLAKVFRRRFRLDGTPVEVEFRTGENPFKGRRNLLTPRQKRHRERLRKRR